MPDQTPVAIAYLGGVYLYGAFPSVPGMSRPRTIYDQAPGACPLIVADTPDAARALNAALADCFRAASVNPDHAAPGVCGDPAQWLTNSEILHAAVLARCAVLNLYGDGVADDPAAPDPAREAAEARWRYHEENDTLDLY
jgi:hypothetical protein